MRLGCRSGGFRRTIERRQLVNVMLGQRPPSEPEEDTSDVWPIPDLDYSSTDDMFNLTRNLREIEQYVLGRGSSRVSVSLGVLVLVPRGN